MSETAAGARVQVIDEALIERIIVRARASARLRSNHNFHPTHADASHRFLNVFVRGTYCAPHRHIAILKPEGFVILRGELVCFIFDDEGGVREQCVLGRNGVFGIDVPPGVWHTVLPVTDVAVCYETKPGPWDAVTDKEFARWAPREDEPGTAEYLEKLMARLG